MRELIWLYLAMLLLFGYVGHSSAQNVKTYIPTRAPTYLGLVDEEARRLHPELETPHYYGALIEHESCVSLTHSKCWNPESRLKTAREEGAGLGQITRAYTASGSLRFDTLSELRGKYMSELKDLSWANVYQRPDLQIRGIVLLSRQNWKSLGVISDSWERLAMSDASYNGGLTGLQNERRACGLAAGCDASKWFDNVERYCLKSKNVLYGDRSACDINRHHVRDVMITRMPKYAPYFTLKVEVPEPEPEPEPEVVLEPIVVEIEPEVDGTEIGMVVETKPKVPVGDVPPVNGPKASGESVFSKLLQWLKGS